MFGYFEVYYDGKKLLLGKKNNKSEKLLQVMVAHRKNGISKNDLIRYLFKGEEVADVSNNLRVKVYRLKQILNRGGVFCEECFLVRDGIYYWNNEIPVVTDTELFDQYTEEASKTEDEYKQQELLYQAFQLYRGEFLEDAGLEEWTVVRSVEYKMKYERAMETLISLLRLHKDYEKMLEVSTKASELYPYSEWQEAVLQSLQALGKKQEALEVYDKVLKIYKEDLDIDIPEKITNQMYELGILSKHKDAEDIWEKLCLGMEKNGAAYLNFQNFVDTFHVMMRISKRNESKLSVMLCELNKEALIAENKEKTERTMEILKEIIRDDLRRGDCFTKYDDIKFLILLYGATEDKCELVFERIDRSFSKVRKSWMPDIRYQVISLEKIYSML